MDVHEGVEPRIEGNKKQTGGRPVKPSGKPNAFVERALKRIASRYKQRKVNKK